MLFFLTATLLMSSVSNVISIFGDERTVFVREYKQNMYSLPIYFFSKIAVE